MTEPCPLQWPETWPRTRHPSASRFTAKPLGMLRKDLETELDRMGARQVVVSTDIPIRGDGRFYASYSTSGLDRGVAVYFHWRGKPHVVACDHYEKIWENLRAITKTIEALRTIERHGASQLLERAVSGFQALPAGAAEDAAPEPWWDVFGVREVAGAAASEIAATPHHPLRGSLLRLIETVYRNEIKVAHPDRGGHQAAVTRLNLAIEKARKDLS